MFDQNVSAIILNIIIAAPAFLLAITVHEFAHGYVALRFGDPTAHNAGRLTFNPISHLDPFGTLVFVVTAVAGFGIGWAKPVPVNPRYMRNPRADMMWVSFAGPGANLATAAALALGLHAIMTGFGGRPLSTGTLFVLNPLVSLLRYGVLINVILAVFNLIPVPPLDGSKILAGLVPSDMAYRLEALEQYGFLILMALIFTGIVGYLIRPPISYIMWLLGVG
jgi:Zn-dependent protease